jgi:Hypervirulence associated proteins TUDOR domain
MAEKSLSKGDPKKGDRVSWKSSGGTAHGKVVKKQTTPTRIKGHEVKASKDNPQFIVETDEGKRAAHKAGALKKE